jgi:hypothetical protein
MPDDVHVKAGIKKDQVWRLAIEVRSDGLHLELGSVGNLHFSNAQYIHVLHEMFPFF